MYVVHPPMTWVTDFKEALMNLDRRDYILDAARRWLETHPPLDRQTFMLQVRARLVAEAGMTRQASYYAVTEMERDLRGHGPSPESLTASERPA
jgi:hypothetical protein